MLQLARAFAPTKNHAWFKNCVRGFQTGKIGRRGDWPRFLRLKLETGSVKLGS